MFIYALISPDMAYVMRTGSVFFLESIIVARMCAVVIGSTFLLMTSPYVSARGDHHTVNEDNLMRVVYRKFLSGEGYF